MKKYLKIAAACLVVLFGMNRCTVACNRGKALEKANLMTVEAVDSLTKQVAACQATADSIGFENRLLQQDTAYLRNELRSLGATNKALLERDRTVNVNIKQASQQ